MPSTGPSIPAANDPSYGLSVLDGRPRADPADIPLAVIPLLDTPDARSAASTNPTGARPVPALLRGMSRSTVSPSGSVSASTFGPCRRALRRPGRGPMIVPRARPGHTKRGHTNAFHHLPRARHQGFRRNATDPVAGQHRPRNRAARPVLLRRACGRRCRPRLCQPSRFCTGRPIEPSLSTVYADSVELVEIFGLPQAQRRAVRDAASSCHRMPKRSRGMRYLASFALTMLRELHVPGVRAKVPLIRLARLRVPGNGPW
jgi:hypothetical protein